MADSDRERFITRYRASAANAQKIMEELEADLAGARELGNEVLVAKLEARKARLEAQRVAATPASAPTRETGSIEKATAALKQENAEKARGVQLELENLAVLQRIAQQRVANAAEEAAVIGQRQAVGGLRAQPAPTGQLALFGPSGRSTAGAYEAMAAQEQAAKAQLQIDAQRAAAQSRLSEQIRRETAERERALALEAQQLKLDQDRAAYQTRLSEGYQAGLVAARQGGLLSSDRRKAISRQPAGVENWGAAQTNAVRLQTRMGEFVGFEENASLATARLSANLTRLGVAEAAASNNLRRHGALTTEFLSALARGETTINEIGYQLGATIAKFGGWAVAAAATYGALGVVVEFGKGALDASSAVSQLNRTIEEMNPDRATKALQDLSQQTNVPMKEAGDATFLFSRTFHDVADASSAARLGLAAFKLDQVDLATSVRLQTQIHQQYGYSLKELGSVYDMLAAGQRLYNARISDVTNTLQKSTGAVKNAGGDLTQLIQLAEYANRITQIGGAQVGTAVYRAASTQAYTPAHRQVIQGYGINVNQGFTQMLMEALKTAATLSGDDRRRLANAIFGNQYGGRVSAIFNPINLPLLQRMTGTGPNAITPSATRGSLQVELDRQLATARERLHAFVNELQRLGATLAETGAFAGLGVALSGLTEVFSTIRDVVNVFNELPAGMRHLVAAAIELRMVMLFFSRTQIGASVPGLRRLRIPGIDQSLEDQQTRARMTTGTRSALQSLENEKAMLSGRIAAAGTTMTTLKAQQAELAAQIAAVGTGTEEQYKLANAKSARILALQSEQAVMEAEMNGILTARDAMNAQMVGLTATRRDKRFTNQQVNDLDREVAATAPGAAAAAQTSAAAATGAAAGRGKVTAALEKERIAVNAAGEASLVEGAAASRMLSATVTGTALMARAGKALEGMRVGMMGMVAAIDPMLVAIIALPEAINLISQQYKTVDDVSSRLLFSKLPPARPPKTWSTSADGLLSKIVGRGLSLPAVKGLWPATDASRQVGIPLELQRFLNPQLDHPTGAQQFKGSMAEFLGYGKSGSNVADENNAALLASARAAQNIINTRRLTAASPVNQVGFSLSELSQEAKADTQAFQQHKISKQEFRRRMDELQRSAHSSLEVFISDDIEKTNSTVTQWAKAVEDGMNAAILAVAHPKDALDKLAALSNKALEQLTQSYSDRAGTYGLSGGDLGKAVQGALVMAARFRKDNNQQDLQAFATATSAVNTAVSKNVTDITRSASLAPSLGEQSGDYTKGITRLKDTRRQWRRWADQVLAKWGLLPGVTAAVNSYVDQIDASLNEGISTLVDKNLSALQALSALGTSKIAGSSPEADLQRAASDIAGLKQRLAYARTTGDAAKVADLQTQLNNAQRTQLASQATNAKNIIDANDAVAKARITGQSPAADIARARADVKTAQDNLNFDKANAAGPAAIANDYAALLGAQDTLNNTIKQSAQAIDQDAAALIQARSDLAQARTQDPVAQAREQLAADLKILGTIKPKDYKTYQEYLAAYTEQQAKIAKDRTSLTSQNVSVQMSTLQFELHTQKISDEQYINGLRQLLHLRKLSLAERQQILSAIYDASQSSAVSLNVGNIKMPSTYEVRRAIAAGHRGHATRGAAVSAMVATTNHFNITVHRDADVRKVTKAISDAIGTNAQGAAQAMGLV